MGDIIGKVEAFFPKVDESKSTYELAKETILALKRYEASLKIELDRVQKQYIELALIIVGKEKLNND